jgi:hypothetical protein
MGNNYYVYIHIRLDNRKPFYIGRGKGLRKDKTDNRNKYWHNVVNKAGGFIPVILESSLTHEQANKVEIKWIKVYKENGFILTNLTNGGGGVSGHHWKRGPLSLHHRKILSSIKQGIMYGKNNPFFGKHHTKESINKFKATLKRKEEK